MKAIKDWLYDGEKPRLFCRRKFVIHYTRPIYTYFDIYLRYCYTLQVSATTRLEEISTPNTRRARNVIFNWIIVRTSLGETCLSAEMFARIDIIMHTVPISSSFRMWSSSSRFSHRYPREMSNSGFNFAFATNAWIRNIKIRRELLLIFYTKHVSSCLAQRRAKGFNAHIRATGSFINSFPASRRTLFPPSSIISSSSGNFPRLFPFFSPTLWHSFSYFLSDLPRSLMPVSLSSPLSSLRRTVGLTNFIREHLVVSATAPRLSRQDYPP